jgi:glutathione S-transferase
MGDTLTFYTHPMSRGRIARWMLEEVGHPYETVVLHYGTSMKSPDYLAVNPMGKVPAIRHCDVVVTETAAICAYLADAYPDTGLAPPSGNARRGPYYRWLFFAAGPVEAAVTAKSMGLLAPADKKAMAGYGSFEEVVDTLERGISEGPYLCGDQFTAADVDPRARARRRAHAAAGRAAGLRRSPPPPARRPTDEKRPDVSAGPPLSPLGLGQRRSPNSRRRKRNMLMKSR